MITQLQELEKTIQEIGKQYHVTATELVNLKANTSNVSTKELDNVMNQLIGVQSQYDTSQKQLLELDDRFQKLTQQFNHITQEKAQLKQQAEKETAMLKEQAESATQLVQQLEQENQQLKKQNQMILQHAKVALDSLNELGTKL